MTDTTPKEKLNARVAVVQCADYDIEKVQAALQKGIDLLGGLPAFCRKGEKILLKPNLLVGEDPQKCTTTHPSVFEAAARVFKQAEVDLYYGDSPAMGKTRKAAAKSGLLPAVEALQIKEADFETAVKTSIPDAKLAKRLDLAAGALEADGIVSLCKMKTHGLTRITGAVKNQFGCIPGIRKGEYHFKMQEIDKFSTVLVDINLFLKPRLYIMDGIVAMEGNGPRGGNPTAMKVLLFSTDPVALDAVFCKLVAIDPEYVPTAKIGRDAGLGTYKFDEIELLGDPIEPLINKDFDIKRTHPDQTQVPNLLPSGLKNMVSPKPKIDPKKCTRCGSCVKICPTTPKAVDWPGGDKKKSPVYDYKTCIRCYCCQEICPDKAISIKTPLLGKLIYR